MSEFMSFGELYERSLRSLIEGQCGCWSCIRERGDVSVGMVLCPVCGNKRCPKASDHTLACTGSNEPGQPGSVYGPPSGTGERA